MQRMSRILTVSSIFVALVGLSFCAIAASPTGSLPPSNAIAGWQVVADTTTSGAMGQKASYDVYNGAVPAMQEQGVRFFAQRMYRHSTTGKTLTVDVYQMTSAATANALFADKQKGFKNAQPLSVQRNIRDRAMIATMGGMTFGVVQRGIFVGEVSMMRATTAQDRSTARAFLVFMSRKFGS